jgi:hypothetical protein
MTQAKTFTFLSALLISTILLSSAALACPASYVKQQAEANQGTDLYNKSAEIADKYMTNRGMNPASPAGEITRPYVIGTTLVENSMYTGEMRKQLEEQGYWIDKERIDLNEDSVDEAVEKALGDFAGSEGSSNSDTAGHVWSDENGLIPASDHFNRHFGNGIFESGDLPQHLESDAHAG